MPSKKTRKIWDSDPKGGRGSSLNPNFYDLLIGTNILGGTGSKDPCHKMHELGQKLGFSNLRISASPPQTTPLKSVQK